MKRFHLWLAAALALQPSIAATALAQARLQISYGNAGVQTVTFGGVVLEDLNRDPDDALHIWHMKSTDLQGRPLREGDYGWGEHNNGKHWDSATRTSTYTFAWGSISVRYEQSGNRLDIAVETKNRPDSGIIFDGATVYPLVLHLPEAARGSTANLQLAANVNAPGATFLSYGQATVAAVDPDPKLPLYTGFAPEANKAHSYAAVVSTTTPDSVPTFFPRVDRPLRPGESNRVTLSLRFSQAGAQPSTLAADVYRAWAKAWPPALQWNDRRIIGTIYLADSPQGDPSKAGGFPNNPRRYFNVSDPAVFDMRTPGGLVAFQARILQQAADNVRNLHRLSAQGAITWDIEGEQFPQPTSYACAPDQLAQLAPEMESVVRVPGSPYRGAKLADAYFKIMREAGLRVGVCVRPQQLVRSSDGTQRQITVDDAHAYGELLRKMQYAHKRWGATLFYVDSSVTADGAPLSATLFQRLAAQLPDSLIAPEESTPKDYAYTAPFQTFLFHTDVGIDPTIRLYYPHAFSLNLVNDVAAAKLTQYIAPITRAVQSGDVLLLHADYWDANNDVALKIYRAAGRHD